MSSINRRTVGVLAIGALATAAFAMPAVGQAKTTKVAMTTLAGGPPPQGGKISGKLKGKPFGSCTMTGTLVLPKSLQIWKCKGGKVYSTSIGTSGASNHGVGNWKFTKGTGKFKGIKGKGTFDGYISTGVFLYKGTAKY